MHCTRCGAANPEDANFCARCGQPLRQGATPETGSLSDDHLAPEGAGHLTRTAGIETPDLEEGTALLVVVRGPNEGDRYLLDRDLVTCGRHPDADIFLDDITVSRRHASFHRDAERYTVRDDSSLNGTYVNGERVDERVLSTGDEVQVGRFKLMAFVAGDDQR